MWWIVLGEGLDERMAGPWPAEAETPEEALTNEDFDINAPAYVFGPYPTRQEVPTYVFNNGAWIKTK